MNKIKNYTLIIISLILLCIIASLGTYFLGRYEQKKLENTPKTEITSQSILNKIHDQYFVVTKTLFFDEKATLVINKGSNINNLLWGEEISASAIVRLDLGVDLNNLSSNDIKVDHTEKTINLKLPEASILDSSIYGQVEYESNKGVLQNFRQLFEQENAEGYNLATEELKKTAEERVKNDPEILNDAEKSSTDLVEIILQDTGYKLITEE